MNDTQDPRSVIAAAIMNAIVETAGGDPASGEPVGIDPTATRQALVVCLASILEADPDVRTPQHMRDARDLVGRELLMQMRAFRQKFESTGKRAWIEAPETLN